MVEPPNPDAPARAARWHLRLLGALELDDGQQALTKLPSRAVTALLARLAMAPQRDHPREELIELLWPGVELDVGRNRLRQALSTLRSLLEPPGRGASTPVLAADRVALRLLPGGVHCDVVAFEQAVARRSDADALAWYRGELLPGFYDEWIADERLRLAAWAERCQQRAAEAGRAPAGAAPGSAAPAPRSAAPGLPVPFDRRRPAASGPHPPALADRPTQPPSAHSAPSARSARPGFVAPAPRPGPTPAERPRPLLPRYLTRLMGAEPSRAALAECVLANRLVTLLGPGGSGKTRLAVETAARLDVAAGPPRSTPAGFDLVAFVPLVGCTDADGLIDALLLALRQHGRGADPMRQLVALLSGRRALLVLDNFEQLVDSGSGVLARLLEATADLHALVTSRRVLGLDGEVQMALQPLVLPAADARGEAAAANPAVALFADRARAARSDFHLGARQLAAVVELVRLLEGMPLAIELAAARVRSLPPQTLVELLREAATQPSVAALELLARSGARGGSDPRHASMLRVVDWSWQLLPHDARRLLTALSVCSGGFTLAAACALNDAGTAQTLQAVDSLAAHSLLRCDVSSGIERWSLYELIREHAVLQLSPEQAAQARARLRQWLITWARALPASPSLPEVRTELANVGVAVASAVADGAPAQAAELALALQAALSDMALPPGMLRALGQAAERLGDVQQQALVHTLLTRAWHRAGDIEATEHHFAAAWKAMPAGGAVRAQVLARLAHIRWRTRRDPGVAAWLEAALPLAEAAGQRSLMASVLSTLGAVARPRDTDRAIVLQRRALATWTEAGDGAGRLTGLYNLSLALNQAARHRPEALELVGRMIEAARDAEDWGQLANGCIQRGEILCRLRRWAEATQAYREALEVSWRALDPLPLAYALWNLPRSLAHQRECHPALRLMAFSARFWVERFGPLNVSDQRDVRRVRRLVQVQQQADTGEPAWHQGRAMTLSEAVALALGDDAAN